jgi:hypothetical protein
MQHPHFTASTVGNYQYNDIKSRLTHHLNNPMKDILCDPTKILCENHTGVQKPHCTAPVSTKVFESDEDPV